MFLTFYKMNTTRFLKKCDVFLTRRFVSAPVNCSLTDNSECRAEKLYKVNKPPWIRYNRAEHGNFYQRKPLMSNPFLGDVPLRRYLDLHLPKEVVKEISKDLCQFGSRIVNEIDDLGWLCELNPPDLQTQNAWGQSVNELTTCNAWKQQHNISAEEGLVALAYERKLDYWSRFHQVCKLYLYSPSSGLYSCPLAMTDGAARTIEVCGKKGEKITKAFKNLTSRVPESFWTSGQWMTEKRGGSDVANGTETVAVPERDFYRLYGYKWFTSATDSNMALTLASIVENDKASQRGLSMFYIETKMDNGQFNNIQMVRLKNKLGTRQLPTAELLLDGSIAYKMSDDGRGISAISNMLNVTRLHNSIAAVATMRRILMLSRDYSHHRTAFGKKLVEFPLHLRVLSKMEIETRGSFLLLLKVATLFGKSELNTATNDEMLLLRLLLPVMKLYTAKQAVAAASEGLEAFGGQGYMEDTRLPQMLRDSQVLPIWEGTTNIMSLDVLRSLSKSNFEVLFSLEKNITLCLEKGKTLSALENSCVAVDKSIKLILQFVEKSPNFLLIASRDLSYSIARSFIGALLIENAVLSKNETDIFSAQQWCEMQDLCPLYSYKYSNCEKYDLEAVMEGYVM